MADLLPAKDIIADALCRRGAGMPSPATFAKADKVRAARVDAGWRLVLEAVWTVDGWNTPWVAHGSEGQAVFAREAAAASQAAAWNEQAGIAPLHEDKRGAKYANERECTAERWDVSL